jgi:hypothetical protein
MVCGDRVSFHVPREDVRMPPIGLLPCGIRFDDATKIPTFRCPCGFPAEVRSGIFCNDDPIAQEI